MAGIHNSQGIHSFVIGDDTPEDRAKKVWMEAEYATWMEKRSERKEKEKKRALRIHSLEEGEEAEGDVEPNTDRPRCASPALDSFSSPAPASSVGVGSSCLVSPPPSAFGAAASAIRHIHNLATPASTIDTELQAIAHTPIHMQQQMTGGQGPKQIVPSSAPVGGRPTAAAACAAGTPLPAGQQAVSMRPSHPQAGALYSRLGVGHVRRSLFGELSRVATPVIAGGGGGGGSASTSIAAGSPGRPAIPPSPIRTNPNSNTNPIASPLALVNKPPPGASSTIMGSFVARKILSSPIATTTTNANSSHSHHPSSNTKSTGVKLVPTAHSHSNSFRPTLIAAQHKKTNPHSIRSFFTPPSASPIGTPIGTPNAAGGHQPPETPITATTESTIDQANDDEMSDGGDDLIIVD